MSDVIERLIQIVTIAPLNDLSVAGIVIQHQDNWHFRHNLMSVYLHFDDGNLLRCADVGQYDRLALSFVADVVFDFDLLQGEEYAATSITELCLKQPSAPLYVNSMTFVVAGTAFPENGIVKCAGFSLQNDDFLFLDPIHLFGIQIGKRPDYEAWLTEFAGREDPLTEWVWRRGDNAFQLVRTL